MGTNTEQKTQVNAESTDVGTGLAADPEDTEVAVVVKLVELALVDGTDTELALDGRNQRRALEEGTSQSLQSTAELRLTARDLVVEADDTDILLTGTLLRLDQAGGTVNANNQTAGDLRVQSTTVTSLLGSVKINWLVFDRSGSFVHEGRESYRRIRFIHATTS